MTGGSKENAFRVKTILAPVTASKERYLSVTFPSHLHGLDLSYIMDI